MPADISVTSNAAKIAKQLQQYKKQIPFTTSRAMQKTVIQAKQDAAKAAARTLDRPTKGLTDTRFNKGWIRVAWPSKQDLRDGKGEAKVFIIDPLVGELHPVVFGGVQRRVPERGDYVVQPTRALMKGLSGQGRLKSLNEFGNIRGFKQKILSRLRDQPELYLNVPIGNTDQRTKHLAPGLYFKGREITSSTIVGKRVDRKLTRSRARLTLRQKQQGKRVRNYLVMLLVYERQRTLKPQGWKYREVVVASFKKNYGQQLRRELAEALRTAR